MTRLSATRSEVATSLVAVCSLLLAVWMLWPAAPDSGEPARPAVARESDPASADPAALGRARTAAALPACDTTTGESVPPGPLAEIRVPCLDGSGTVDLGSALAGRTTVINLWASWCPPCRTELPALAEYAGRPDSPAVLTVNVRDDPVVAVELLAELDARLPAVADPDGRVRAVLRAPPTLPFSFVARPDGSVVPVEPPIPFRTADEVAAAVARPS